MPDFPKLRPIEAIAVRAQGREMILLRDPAQIAPEGVAVPPDIYFMLTLFDGKHSVREIQAECTRAFGQLMFSDRIQQVIDEMDQHLLMDSERFAAAQEKVTRQFREAPLRVATHCGTAYEAEPEALRAQLDGFFDAPRGPKEGGMEPVQGEVVAAIAPHIDFHRGGPTYAWCYEALRQACHADLFIIFGTAHFGGDSLYIATAKDFETPLGVAKCDRAFVETLAGRCEADLFADELVHKGEHSVEFQVVFLQHIFPDRDFQIVPILCGDFHECIESGTPPIELPEVRGFVEALRETLNESGRKACLLVGADLSHVGRRFGDQERLTQGFVQITANRDAHMLERVVLGDAQGFFEHIKADQDRRRICGFPSIYTVLHLLDSAMGRVLQYDFAVDEGAQTAVSFASVAFT